MEKSLNSEKNRRIKINRRKIAADFGTASYPAVCRQGCSAGMLCRTVRQDYITGLLCRSV